MYTGRRVAVMILV